MIGVDCIINQEYSVSCMQNGDEVYVPFSFLRDYFEVYGSLSTIGKGPARFEWSHSNAKINYPKGTYDPKGIFMYFENYNVEVSYLLQESAAGSQVVVPIENRFWSVHIIAIAG